MKWKQGQMTNGAEQIASSQKLTVRVKFETSVKFFITVVMSDVIQCDAFGEWFRCIWFNAKSPVSETRFFVDFQDHVHNCHKYTVSIRITRKYSWTNTSFSCSVSFTNVVKDWTRSNLQPIHFMVQTAIIRFPRFPPQRHPDSSQQPAINQAHARRIFGCPSSKSSLYCVTSSACAAKSRRGRVKTETKSWRLSNVHERLNSLRRGNNVRRLVEIFLIGLQEWAEKDNEIDIENIQRGSRMEFRYPAVREFVACWRITNML
jgi:hypothetical protein